MATIPTLMYPESDENIIPQLISWSLASDADLFDVADHCAALVSVLVETDDSETAIALCNAYCKPCANCVNSAMSISRRTWWHC